MGPGNEPPSSLQEAYRYSGLGCVFAATVLAFLGGGWLLDRWLETVPVFMIVGALAGAGLATVSIYRSLIGGNGRDDSTGEQS